MNRNLRATLGEVYREQPNRDPARVFEIYRTSYAFNPRLDKDVKKLPREKVVITGVVSEKDLPEEGGKFIMHYHKRNGFGYFGTLSLDDCQNVVIEDEHYYFESKPMPPDLRASCYILVPCLMD